MHTCLGMQSRPRHPSWSCTAGFLQSTPRSRPEQAARLRGDRGARLPLHRQPCPPSFWRCRSRSRCAWLPPSRGAPRAHVTQSHAVRSGGALRQTASCPAEPREAEWVVQGHPTHQDQTSKCAQATRHPVQSRHVFQRVSTVPMNVLKKDGRVR